MNDQVSKLETAEILRLAEQALAAPGDFVELGCYRGDTSILLAQLLQKSAQTAQSKDKRHSNNLGQALQKSTQTAQSVENCAAKCGKPVEKVAKPCEKPVENSRHLWIYDSFAGLPEKTREDASGAGANFQKGELLVTKREVVDKIRRHGLRNVIVKKAWFDELSAQDLPAEIAFAFCDGDLYRSIRTSLQLVVPRLAGQGIIVVHDYNNPELPGSARAVDEFLRTHPGFRLQVRQTLAIITKGR